MYLPKTDITKELENIIDTPAGRAIMVGGLLVFSAYVIQSMVRIMY